MVSPPLASTNLHVNLDYSWFTKNLYAPAHPPLQGSLPHPLLTCRPPPLFLPLHPPQLSPPVPPSPPS
ncbi:unnamed protein product [Staurois parvus]|uniref:Uncharacterized protein n=1 Tax=Staurois parvus TaxID=386267 RepID=A0ABN9HQA9_9NEOB|nr:unnamed protein product [Staurois parvus]